MTLDKQFLLKYKRAGLTVCDVINPFWSTIENPNVFTNQVWKKNNVVGRDEIFEVFYLRYQKSCAVI